MVAPPANGRKLWRVPRKPLTTANPEHNTSQECLKNSLKIVAAGKAYLTKRPPLRRPKNQPGKPKDFVFVDLSPIRSEEEETKKISSSSPSVTTKCFPAAINVSPLSEASNDSFSITSDDESMFSLYDSTMSNETVNEFNCKTQQSNIMPEISMSDINGLGLSMDDFQFDMTAFQSNFNSYPQQLQQTPQQQQQPQFDFTTPQRSTTNAFFATPERKRAASSAFEYKTPTPRKNFRQQSMPELTPNLLGLEAFMMFNDQITTPTNNNTKEIIPSIPRAVSTAADAFDISVNAQYSPITDDSEIEDFQNIKLGKPIEFSNFDENLLSKGFDLNAFIAF